MLRLGSISKVSYEKYIRRGGSGPLFFVVLMNTFLLAGCSSQVTDLNELISKSGYASTAVKEFQTSSGVPIQWAAVNRVKSGSVTFYIEGDGDAYVSRSRPSRNPTPTQPLALNLALVDKSQNIYYLARPCQFIPTGLNKRCKYPVWTTDRFSPEVAGAYSDLISSIVNENNFKRVTLVGFSGGASIILQVAPLVKTVDLLKTVAGYIMRQQINISKGVPTNYPLTDPYRNIKRIVSIPQIHFSGSKDRIISSKYISHFSQKVNELGGCSKHIEVRSDHQSDWLRYWPRLLTEIPPCY